jgi:hypothetical protein
MDGDGPPPLHPRPRATVLKYLVTTTRNGVVRRLARFVLWRSRMIPIVKSHRTSTFPPAIGGKSNTHLSVHTVLWPMCQAPIPTRFCLDSD